MVFDEVGAPPLVVVSGKLRRVLVGEPRALIRIGAATDHPEGHKTARCVTAAFPRDGLLQGRVRGV